MYEHLHLLLLGHTRLSSLKKASPELSITLRANTAAPSPSLQVNCNKSSIWQIDFDDQFDTTSLSLSVYCGWVNALIIMVLIARYYSLSCFYFLVFVWGNFSLPASDHKMPQELICSWNCCCVSQKSISTASKWVTGSYNQPLKVGGIWQEYEIKLSVKQAYLLNQSKRLRFVVL